MMGTDPRAPAQTGEVLIALGAMAARLAAERNRESTGFATLQQCLAALDRVVETVAGSQADLLEYARLCEEFQGRLLDLARSPALARHLSGPGLFRSDLLPALMTWKPSDLAGFLLDDQRRRYQVFRAIVEGEGFTAESLMREYGRFYRAVWAAGRGEPAAESGAGLDGAA